MLCNSIETGSAPYVPKFYCRIPWTTDETPWKLRVEYKSSNIECMTFQYFDTLDCILIPYSYCKIIWTRGKYIWHLRIINNMEYSFFMTKINLLWGWSTLIHITLHYGSIHSSNNIFVSQGRIPADSKNISFMIDLTSYSQICIFLAVDNYRFSFLTTH